MHCLTNLEPEVISSPSWFGLRCGFLGLLHELRRCPREVGTRDVFDMYITDLYTAHQ